MRIAFVVTEFPALSETFILNQITGLIDLGHEVDIIAGQPHQINAQPDFFRYNLAHQTTYRVWVPRNPIKRAIKAAWLFLVHFHQNPRALLLSLSPRRIGSGDAFLQLFYDTIPFLGRKKYDAIVCHFGENGIRLTSLQQIDAVQGKLFTFFHGADITRYVLDRSERVYDALFEHGSRFLPISERWRSRLLELGCRESKISVHHMGIDCRKFTFTARTSAAQRHIKIVSIARLVEKKGLEYGIEAVGLLRLPPGTRVTLEVIGDGPLRESLQRKIVSLQLEERVVLSGWRDQSYVVAALAEASVMIAPSVTAADGDQEGIPVVLMEAMASGLPVVSTYHSGIPELILDGVSGLLVKERDSAALAAAIQRLVDDSALRESISRGGRLAVESQWNIEILNRRLEELCAAAG